MLDVHEVRLGGDLPRPRLDLRAGHFDRSSAYSANQMVVMLGGVAGAVEELRIGAQNIDFPLVQEDLEGAVDGRQSDPGARLREVVVQLLCGNERGKLLQALCYRLALGCVSCSSHVTAFFGLRRMQSARMARPVATIVYVPISRVTIVAPGASLTK